MNSIGRALNRCTLETENASMNFDSLTGPGTETDSELEVSNRMPQSSTELESATLVAVRSLCDTDPRSPVQRFS